MTGGALPSLDGFTRYSGIGAITPLGVVAVALLANGLGEETGWRGFAADRLLRDHRSDGPHWWWRWRGAAGTCRSSGWSLATAAWGRS
jgi:membrane protease YdiL (CAAX protease family)